MHLPDHLEHQQLIKVSVEQGPDRRVDPKRMVIDSGRDIRGHLRQLTGPIGGRQGARVHQAKPPFGGPTRVLAYLARHTHRVAISNSRLVTLDQARVTFKWKDYRIKGRDRLRTMTLDAAEFIRRFLLHVLPRGFHRIRPITACLPASFERTTSRMRAICWPRPRPRPSARAPKRTARPKQLRLRVNVRVAAAG